MKTNTIGALAAAAFGFSVAWYATLSPPSIDEHQKAVSDWNNITAIAGDVIRSRSAQRFTFDDNGLTFYLYPSNGVIPGEVASLVCGRLTSAGFYEPMIVRVLNATGQLAASCNV